MKFKKLLSTVMAMAIVSAIGANAFALDKSVTVYKNIVNNEFYTGMGAHAQMSHQQLLQILQESIIAVRLK